MYYNYNRLKMVNFEWYRTFKAIYKCGTLTSAAESLFISQPGVSLHLSSLEAYVGYKLLERKGKKMIPTERGKILYNAISSGLTVLEEAEKNFQRSTEKDTPTISIGMCFETFQITLEQYISSLPFNVIIRFGEYREMLDQLDKGILDLVITPFATKSNTIEFEAFASETIVLVSGREVDSSVFLQLAASNDILAMEEWMKSQKWYGTAGDMEHLFNFWQCNFNKQPDFRPNYIVPNLNSIVRCLSSGKGLAVIPDFLCRKAIEDGDVQLIWKGNHILKNTLSFANRKNTLYKEEIEIIKTLFRKIKF